MAKLKFKNSKGEWESIAAFQGEPGKDGAIQYTAGKGISIENDVISAEVDKQYVDDSIAGIDVSNNNEETIPVIYSDVEDVLQDGGSLGATCHAQLSEVINKYKASGKNLPAFVLQSARNQYQYAPEAMIFRFTYIYPLNNTRWFYQGDIAIIKSFNGNTSSKINSVELELSVAENNGVYTVGGSRLKVPIDSLQVLDFENTYAFTPTANYHPATKKYVDDSIKTAITDALGGSY